MVRAKFRVTSVTDYGPTVTIDLAAVTGGSDENKTFWQYTPAGNIKLSTVNKAAAAYFLPEHEYYVDFTKAE